MTDKEKIFVELIQKKSESQTRTIKQNLRRANHVLIEMKFKKYQFNKFKNVKSILTFLNLKYPKPNSRKSYLSSICSIVKHLDGYDECYKEYSLSMMDIVYKLDRNVSQSLSDRQKKNYIAWADVMQVRDELMKLKNNTKWDYENYLIVCFNTYMPPMRRDMPSLKIIRGDDVPVDDLNYLQIKKNEINVIMRDYKTSKKYGEMKLKVPDDLENIIRGYLKQYESQYLLMNSRGQRMSKGVYSARIRKIFNQYTGRNVGQNGLRSAYLSHLYGGLLPLVELNEIHRVMMNSMKVALVSYVKRL